MIELESDVPPPIVVRAVQPDELPYVIKTWLDSYRQAPAMRGIHRGLYDVEQHRVIEQLLLHSECLIAHGEGMSAISGWLVRDGSTLHYVYVRALQRRAGIARKLLQFGRERVRRYSHRTEVGCAFVAREASSALYDPWAAQRPPSAR